MGRASAILADLARHKTAFDFTQNDLADSVAEAASIGMFTYMDDELDPDGVPWIELTEAYAKRKAILAPGAPMAVLHGIMRQMAQLKGTLDIYPHYMTQTYGLDAQAEDEAGWFSARRRFFELNDLCITLLKSLFDNHFRDIVRP